MVESVSLKVLALKQFFEEQINFPIQQRLPLESCDIDFATSQIIGNGCDGVVCKSKVYDAFEFKERTCTTVPYDEFAFKMMYNFIGSDDPSSMVQKRKFDKEYIFPLAHPHWSHVQIFNYFRYKTAYNLLNSETDKELFVDTTTYFIMELCKSNLTNYIKENKDNISVSSALLMIYQILNGITHLYDHDVVHLNLTSRSILIANRKKIKGNQVVISDFGTIHPFIYKDHQAGTPIYRSPELLQFKVGHPVDIRKNDVWAAGCILFQMLEGNHPFDVMDFKHNICNGRLPLTTFDKHGEGIKQFLKLLWNRDPNKRVDPTTALWICGLLLWGPSELRTKFKTFCTTTCKQYSEQDCEQWIRRKINEIYAAYNQNQNNDELFFILQVHFFTSISSSELLGAMTILSTIYD